MGQFILRHPSGGSALRDGDSLRDGFTAATYAEVLADTLLLDTPGDALTDGDGNIITDGNGHPLLADSDGWDRLAHRETLADGVSFSDSQGGGTAYTSTSADTMVFTTITGDTFGGGTGADYTHVGADTLLFTTDTSDLFNYLEVSLQPTVATPWGRTQEWNAWVELTIAGDVVASSAEGDFQLVGGRLTEDLTRSIVGDVSLDLAFPAGSALIPTRLGDLLDPHGQTAIKVWAGYRGREVPMGLFDLATTPLTLDLGGLRVAVTGMSFERLIQRAGFWEVVSLGPGFADIEAREGIYFLTRTVLGANLPVQIDHNPIRMPTVTYKPGDDRLSAIAEIANGARMDVRFNRVGVFTVTNIPSNVDALEPRWNFTDGDNGTILSATREFSDAESFNGVLVEGTAQRTDSAGPVYYMELLQNPSSPLYFNPTQGPGSSRWGPRIKHIRNEFVATLEQAAGVAKAYLAELSAVSDTVVVRAPANAEIEVTHIAQLTSADLGVDDPYRVTRVIHDLSGGPVEVTLHRWRGI